MIAFIDDHRVVHGVEPICKVLPIAPSTYYDRAAKRADPEKRSARARRDDAVGADIGRVFVENFEVYGAQGLAAVAAGRSRRRPLHGGTADARHGHTRRGPRQVSQDDGRRQDDALPGGSRQSPVPRAGAEHALGIRFHLCRDVARLCSRRGTALFTWRSSSIRSPGASSVGG